MDFKEDHSAAKDLTIKITIASIFLNLLQHIFSDTAMSVNYPDTYNHDFFLISSYFYVTLLYSLTYQQFIFATSSIRSRFDLLNMNLKFVPKFSRVKIQF